MREQSQKQSRVSRLNQVAEELLRALVKANNNDDSSSQHKEAELLLSEFMRLMGYQLQ